MMGGEMMGGGAWNSWYGRGAVDLGGIILKIT
jgi:hypothetical protein